MRIDPEFKAAILELWPEERQQLEQNILAYGCRDPLVLWQDVLLDGHNRYEICQEHGLEFDTVEVELPDREAALDWIDANQLGRRNLTPDAFRLLLGRRYNRMKKAHGGDRKSSAQNEHLKTSEKLAKEHGTSQATVRRAGVYARKVEENPELQKAIKERKPVSQVKRELKEDARKAVLEQPADPELIPGIYVEDFYTGADRIADESVDLVFTDPPYNKKAVDLYRKAAKVAARILKPGGSFIAYSGQKYLPDVYGLINNPQLRYWWTFAGIHSGGNQMLQKLGIRCGWKPIVWYVKGTRGDVSEVLQDVITGTREKSHHEWQQALVEAEHFIEKLTFEDGLVVDFFLGGGTTKVAADKLGRRFIGFELDPETAEKAKQRIEDAA